MARYQELKIQHLKAVFSTAAPAAGGSNHSAGSSRQLDEVLDFLRRLTAEVYPVVHRDLGLVDPLEWERRRVTE